VEKLFPLCFLVDTATGKRGHNICDPSELQQLGLSLAAFKLCLLPMERFFKLIDLSVTYLHSLPSCKIWYFKHMERRNQFKEEQV